MAALQGGSDAVVVKKPTLKAGAESLSSEIADFETSLPDDFSIDEDAME